MPEIRFYQNDLFEKAYEFEKQQENTLKQQQEGSDGSVTDMLQDFALLPKEQRVKILEKVDPESS